MTEAKICASSLEMGSNSPQMEYLNLHAHLLVYDHDKFCQQFFPDFCLPFLKIMSLF